jgi:hypothetical protein
MGISNLVLTHDDPGTKESTGNFCQCPQTRTSGASLNQESAIRLHIRKLVTKKNVTQKNTEAPPDKGRGFVALRCL